ncbi:MAG: glycosyl hydrolase family 2, partial [Acidimicrobiaceae bacterium]|nr:glycosyl hydrolase family 2 [Acidimicrobiaceae bacterium]
IWQPVWLEPRPATFVRSMHLEPKTSLDGFVVRLQVEGAHASGARCELHVEGGAVTRPVVLGPDGRAEVILAIESPRTWSPEEPHLYRIIARLESADGVDEVACTSGLRSIEVVGDELHLNGRRAYLRGVLDQGYWPRSGLTAPSPAALRRDLDLAREAGYNLVRKHLKLEDPRWLHYADTIGMLVWEEPPSTSRFSDDSLAAFRQGVQQMVARDANHPCIVVWGCFNEEWGLDWRVVDDPVLQDAVDGTVAQLRSLDESRPIVDNSGWSHVGGDLADWHYYEPDLARWAKNVEHLVEDETAVIPVPLHPPALELKPLAARPGAMKGRPNLNGEYGVGMTSVERGWHLKWQTQELRRHDRLSGYVYTELYDIEHEFAGVISAERAPKDLGNVALSDVNAETVLVLDVLPEQPGIDLRVSERRFVLGVRCSHHGARRVAGMLRVAWGPHFGPPPVRTADASGAELGGEPFVLSAPVSVTAELPESERAGRLHVWLEREGRVLAATHLDVVQADA